MPVAVSLFASAVRPQLWPAFFKSLEGTSVEYEVVFAGNAIFALGYFDANPQVGEFRQINELLTYIQTENIKPSQCYHITSQHCTGETISWSCDDAEAVNDIYGKAYKYWKSCNNEKLILSLQTKESGYGTPTTKLFDMKQHTFYSLMPDTPLMAPMGLMSRKFFNDLGGYDRRYVAGQAENDLVMRAYQNGATVEIFGDESTYIDIDHLGKSIAIGESTDEESFRERPFAKGYSIDRQVLETSWTTFNEKDAFLSLQAGERPFSLRRVSPVQLDQFQPYEDKDILIKSQGNNLPERWV